MPDRCKFHLSYVVDVGTNDLFQPLLFIPVDTSFRTQAPLEEPDGQLCKHPSGVQSEALALPHIYLQHGTAKFCNIAYHFIVIGNTSPQFLRNLCWTTFKPAHCGELINIDR